MIIVAARRASRLDTLDSEFLSQGCGARPAGRERGVIKPCHPARRSLASTAFALLLLTLLPRALSAQTLPAGPATAFDGRLAAGAEVVATIGDHDESAFFNYTDYEHNVLRMFRVALSGSWRPFERLAFVGEVQSEDLTEVRPYAAYVRIRPIRSVPLDIQAGRIPPVFGSFGRRAYNVNNPVIGYPLAYQYLTSLRPDAIPATHDDLLRMRARGWLATYPVGSPDLAPGIPLISAFRWDTGVQAHWRHGHRGGRGRGDGRHAGRPSRQRQQQWTPDLGTRGAASRHRPDRRRIRRTWRMARSRGHGTAAVRTRPRTIRQRGVWTPSTHAITGLCVRSWSRAVGRCPSRRLALGGEHRCAGRVGRGPLSLYATDLRGRAPRSSRLLEDQHRHGSALVTWDAPVTRVETAVGYYLQRNLVARVTVQYNNRDGGRIERRTYFAGQLAYWF